ncbi:hypothetical protein HPHPP11B_0353 [Helicobacter pylori Hp P-11b]|uniref:Uncharacterized protein n=1 Tax=Helicobacter pylori Hp P-11b TaxID=992106 RepID=J0S2L6_HELPX|nr:hypothetical protein HPHPP11B_0353 [Helicobacter pylori Hp P-11b]
MSCIRLSLAETECLGAAPKPTRSNALNTLALNIIKTPKVQ